MNKIAIITRTKDRPLFLRRALKSVEAQTFNDYVHVIINDGGDMELVDRIVKELSAEQRKKTEVYHRPKSSNAPDTIFNESVDRVESELVVIHDDDDTWHEEFLQRTISILDKHTDIAGVVVRVDKVIEKVKDEVITLIKKLHYMPDMRAISLYRQCIDNQLTPIAFVYRRNVYEEIGKYDDTLPVVGDWEFGLRLLQNYDVAYLDPGFALANYHHRRQGNNSFSSHDHRTYITQVHNRYLRADLKNGNLGIGYIMNDLRYQQDFITTTIKKLLPNFATKFIRRKVR